MPAIALRHFNYQVKETSLLWSPYNSPLVFKEITLADLPLINDIVRQSHSFTCDYTIGGIFMWVDYFHYRFCIYRDTLFISGVEENRLDKLAFSCPVGKLPLPQAIALLKDYCDERNLPLEFSAVPADYLACFTTFAPKSHVEELTDWSDYVYEAEAFATLSGKKMAKKRNHVNRFMTDNPEAVTEPLTEGNVSELIESLMEWESAALCDDAPATKLNELEQVVEILRHSSDYPFEGMLLRTSPTGPIAAFTMAEVIGDMAFIHIEKMNHDVPGAGETVAHLFVKHLLQRLPGLKYLNREEDCGDEGLRRAKESWHPAMLLRKYNVTIA